jgi:hypothetical protein
VVTSTYPIVGSCGITRAPGGQLAAAYYGLARGYSRLVFPVAYRVKEESAWRHYSGIGIQNVDPENAISVHLEWMGSDGEVLLEFDDDTIPPYATHGYNTRYSDDQAYGDLGDSWRGTVIVTTDSPLGIAGVILNQATLADYQYVSQYNGVPAE